MLRRDRHLANLTRASALALRATCGGLPSAISASLRLSRSARLAKSGVRGDFELVGGQFDEFDEFDEGG
jgi:hypothetical protein